MAQEHDDPFLDDPETMEEEALEAEELQELEPPSIEEVEDENIQLKDRLMRSMAETENMRKRGERDRREAELYGGTKLARDLLSVHDNLGRALENLDDQLRESNPKLVEGLELTLRELLAVFEKHKILKIDPEIGDKFDAKVHQAMFEAPVPNTKKGSIIQVMASGFVVGNRLIRAAQVGISSNTDPVAPVKTDPEKTEE
ncbi:MAG: nucleotide exchange factor GrpE [Rhodobacteraceae bacterium]|nr:nucleotide exchange factor GrpE [Paracoccaceae bacterium]